MTDLTDPIDDVLAMCVAARNQIRHDFGAAHARVAVWEPAPFDPNWDPSCD
jgi:hypothetical protein